MAMSLRCNITLAIGGVPVPNARRNGTRYAPVTLRGVFQPTVKGSVKMSTQPTDNKPKPVSRRLTTVDIRNRKKGEPLVCLTAYTTPMARLIDPHCDLILVGDSLGMVVHGLDSTVGVTLEMMELHGKAVMRGSSRACVVVDLPFGSYEEGRKTAYRNAARLMQEVNCQAVKLEGGVAMADKISFLVERGIPVVGHIGLQPQSVNTRGGYQAAGRTRAEWGPILEDARAVEEAGAFAVVVEGVAQPLADKLSRELTIPTIGIGASAQCDGQILVTEDMLGMGGRVPKFVKKYADLAGVIEGAVSSYKDEVRDRTFPGEAHTYAMRPGDKAESGAEFKRNTKDQSEIPWLSLVADD